MYVDRCQAAYGRFENLPEAIFGYIHPFTCIWDFVFAKPDDQTADELNATCVAKWFSEILVGEVAVDARAVCCWALSHLLWRSSWLRSNKDHVLEQMRVLFHGMETWGPGRGRTMLAMTYFGDDDYGHGVWLRGVLAIMNDQDERAKLVLYICGKVNAEMATGILGF